MPEEMNKYLRGYLASIPKSEYDNVMAFLKDALSDKISLSDEQFDLLMSQIVEDRQPATATREVKYNEKPSDTYNDFFSKVYIDLNYLFKVIGLLYNAIDGYSSLSTSYLSDIKGEIDRLEVMINELIAKESYSDNAIVVTETFKDTSNFELYSDTTSYLFCDRDGTPLRTVDLLHDNTKDMITLNVEKNVDLLHGQDGKPHGRLDVTDYRGMPIDTYAVKSNAIDNSSLSYWDCSVISDEPISIGMDPFEEGGAYIKFKVRLPVTSNITEISLTPYCTHPVEVCDIIVGEKSVLGSLKASVDTVTVRSAQVPADEITFIMRQKNYIHTNVTTNAKLDEAEELWSTVFDRVKDSYVTQPSRKTDNDVFLKYAGKKENEMEQWNKEFIRQNEIGGR